MTRESWSHQGIAFEALAARLRQVHTAPQRVPLLVYLCCLCDRWHLGVQADQPGSAQPPVRPS